MSENKFHTVNGFPCEDSNCWCAELMEEEENVIRDAVNHPEHYQLDDLSVEALDVIQAAMTKEERIGYFKGNCIKYLLRANKKNGEEDLRKMIFYAIRLEKCL